MFQLSMPKTELKAYVINQLDHFFPDKVKWKQETLFDRALGEALERSEYCFQFVALDAYHKNGTTYFSHLHADQYTVFLWYLSNAVWKIFQDHQLASKFFYLNKALNGILCMYDAEMPDIFLILHGAGSVLGKAVYTDFFVACHNCTVGAVHGGYPKLGKGVAMAPMSVIVGSCTVGNNVTIGTQAMLRNRDIKSGLLYYRDVNSGEHQTKLVSRSWAQSYFNVPIED